MSRVYSQRTWQLWQDKYNNKLFKGNLDNCKLNYLFPGDEFGFPMLKHSGIDIKQLEGKKAVCYHQKWARGEDLKNYIIDFFIDDCNFEVVWSRYQMTGERVKKAAAVCTPDFSVYFDTPLPVSLYQIYRSRWLGAYWQSIGARVLINLQVGATGNFFDSIETLPKNDYYCLGTPSLRYDKSWHDLLEDLEKAIDILKPKGLIAYGIDGAHRLKQELKNLDIYSMPRYYERKTRVGYPLAV